MSPIIQVQSLYRSYKIGNRKIPVLNDIQLEIQQGECVFLCGPSGAGKTTLLYTLAGLEPPEQGSVCIQEVNLYALSSKEQARFRNQHIGYVFQNFNLLPELTAMENVLVPAIINGKNQAQRAAELLQQVGLKERMDHLPSELSGGEQQRVAIARALINQPSILFADEPTGNLDSQHSREVMELLTQTAKKHHITLVIVTHDEVLGQSGDRRLMIRDGRIQPS